MESTAVSPKQLRFGPFELDFDGERLLRNGIGVRLQDQPLKLLLLLLDRPGDVVSRSEMRMRLWPGEAYGDFDNGLNVAIKKLRTALGDDPDQPKYVETIPRRGYRFIAPIEAQLVPKEHTACGSLGRLAKPAKWGERGNERLSFAARHPLLIRRILWFAATSLTGACLLAFKGHTHDSTHSLRDEMKNSTARRSVAVLDFRNSSGKIEDAWLCTALSEMLSTELAASDRLRLVPGEDVEHANSEWAFSKKTNLSRNDARQLRRALDADLVVSGSFITTDPSGGREVRVDVQLQDATTGEILSQFSEKGTEPGLFGVIGNTGARLRQKLGVAGVSGKQQAQVLASMPSKRESSELYSMGLAKLRNYDPLSAVDLLKRAIDAEPTFPLTHSALSEAWARLGYDQRSLEEARKADQLSSGLAPAEQLCVQAGFLEAKRDWNQAAEAYRSLHTSFPDDPEHSLHFAHALVRAGKGQEAAIVLASVRSLQDSDRAKAMIDAALAEAYASIGSLDRALNAAQNSVGEARNQDRLLLLARSLRTQALVSENLARYDMAMAAVREAKTLYEQAGDRFGLASVQEVEGNILSDTGQYAPALTRYQEELTTVRAIGNRRGEASALNNSALVLYRTGDLTSSRAMMEMALAAFIELSDKNNEAVVRINIGGILKDQGDLAAAMRQYNIALSICRETRDSGGTILALHGLSNVSDAMADYQRAWTFLKDASDLERTNGLASPSSEGLLDQGDLQRHQGDLEGARKSYKEALASSRKSDEKEWTAYALFGLGKVAVLSADFAEARANYDQALKLRTELGETLSVAETKLAIAEEAIKEGRPSDVIQTLQALRDQFYSAGRQDEWISTALLISEEHLLEGKVQDARHELERLPPSLTIQSAEVRWEAGVVRGRVQAAEGRLFDARRTLKAVLRESSKANTRKEAFEAQLALANMGTSKESRKGELDQVFREATDARYELIASEARKATLVSVLR